MKIGSNYTSSQNTWLWRCNRYLSDGHGAEDVQEDEGAVGVILAQQVTVRQALDVGQRHERQLGHNSAVKAGQKVKETKVRHREQSSGIKERQKELYFCFVFS